MAGAARTPPSWTPTAAPPTTRCAFARNSCSAIHASAPAVHAASDKGRSRFSRTC
jgi:hypothetical protein